MSVPTPVANAAQAQGLPPAAAPAAASAETNPEDLAPAAEPAPLLGSHVRRGTAEGVPLYQDAAVVPGTHIPQLRLDLHVYAARPEERFVMINMKKLREGDSLPEGVRVESITPEGAILSYSGSRFMLPSQ
jgi:general secretion pathway protein B